MSGLRRVGWALPVALGALAVALVVAVVVARHKRSSSAAPAIVNGVKGKSPATAAFSADATYGAGLTHVVRSPVAILRPTLGEVWRELGGSVGRVLILPSGTPSRYFEVSAVTIARHGSARLAMLTSEGQRAIELVRTGDYNVTNFGPLLAPKHGRIGLALTSVQPHSTAAGPNMVLSPLQAEYLAKGEWVTGMPALAEVGPDGLRGVYLAGGSTTRFAMTPGIRGGCNLSLRAASIGGALRVSFTVGTEVRSAIVSSHSAVVHIGPFSHASIVLSLSVRTPVGKSKGSLFIGDMHFVAASA